MLSRTNLVNSLKIFGRKALNNKQVLNTLYKLAHRLREVEPLKAFELLETLLRFGANNFYQLDYYFVFLASAHHMALNRHDLLDA